MTDKSKGMPDQLSESQIGWKSLKEELEAKKTPAFQIEEMDEWPCQQLLGGVGEALYSNANDMCKHDECHPKNDDRKNKSMSLTESRTKLLFQLAYAIGWLEESIKKHSRESGCDTPDFILAEYLKDCLEAFEKATNTRTGWFEKE